MKGIFIVDDEAILVRLYEDILTQKGYTVQGTAKDGKEAVEKFKEFDEKPAVIIMDQRMPIKDGLQAAKEILEIDSTAKILFVSADKTQEGKALALGAIGFIKKPFDFNTLFTTLNSAMN